MTASTSALMDRIRGISAMAVAAVHAFQIFALPYLGLETPAHLWTSLAATYAVLLFFVVSGFMIFWSVRGHTKDGDFNWRTFAVARLVRIYPPLLAAILITAVVAALINIFQLHGAQSYRLGEELFLVRDRAEFSGQTLIATLLLSYGTWPGSPPPLEMNGPLWTLGYEFWFYFLVMFTINAKAGRWASGILPLAAFFAICLYGRNQLQAVFLAVWMCGFGLGWLSAKGGIPQSRWLAVIVVGLAGLYLSLARDDLFEVILHPYAYQWLIVLIGAIFSALIAMAIQANVKSTRGPVARAAGFSYSLYVMHFPILMLAFSLLHPLLYGRHWTWTAATTTGVFLLCVGVARVISRVVENRTLVRTIIGAKRV